MISVIALVLVFLLIIIRRIGSLRLQIWQIMGLGAIAVLMTLQITPLDALKAINLDVMFFLLGMFIVGEALVASGYLSFLSYKLFRRAKSLDVLVLFILLGMGITAAFLMNDTLAIIGTPLVLLLARKTDTPPKILLLALAFAVTIGTVMSPIGNPQNLLIAVNGNMANPFITFFRYLLLPTLINLFLAYLILKLFYRKQFERKLFVDSPEIIKDPELASLCRISLILLVVLIAAKVIIVFAGINTDFRLTYIALAAALPIVLFSPNRFLIMRKIDWSTLIFFASMFILMASVWNSGVFQKILNSANLTLTSIPVILGVSVGLSQFISNVPLVGLYLPMLMKIGVTDKGLLALAAGSTIAGNLTVLGAASNVIIIQNAEQKSGETLTFWEFFRIGLPLTTINVFVYWLFFTVVK